ncbi:MAG TPA: polysaccharide deacetylase [Candidatus Binataceae bacterium]|nr:polysaccharide deacetylase [Candidatus Binataceae bacterium]
MPQVSGRVKLPKGKKIAVNLGCDFDAQSLWICLNLTSPAYMSRGEFGAEIGMPRLMRLFEKHKVRSTFCIPGHTIDTWPDICRELVAAGHEIGHHGYAHENPQPLTLDQETRMMEMGLEALARIGVKPRAYRSPYWDLSDNTLGLLEKYGFDIDSSLQANDFYPYWVRPVEVHADRGNVFGPPTRILEIPGQWYLTDFAQVEYVTGFQEGMRPADDIFDRWKAIFDYAVENEKGACYAFVVHPQSIGRAHMITRLERLIEHMKRRGAWFATLSEIADATERVN